jgi:hypothetical protein
VSGSQTRVVREIYFRNRERCPATNLGFQTKPEPAANRHGTVQKEAGKNKSSPEKSGRAVFAKMEMKQQTKKTMDGI